MKRYSIRLMIALLTFSIALLADSGTNRAIDYLWPDAEFPDLKQAPVPTLRPDGYIYSIMFCGRDKSGHSSSPAHKSDKRSVR